MEASISHLERGVGDWWDEETDVNGTVIEKTPEQLAAEQALIDNLFAATIAAASQVGTGRPPRRHPKS